jgi:hypothetical protein
MESFVDASCKLLLDGIDRVLQQVSARYDLDVAEVRREFLLPLIDSQQVVAPSKEKVAAPKVAAPRKKKTIAPEEGPKPKPEGPKCVARSIRGTCTRTATKPGCLCTLHFRLSTGPIPIEVSEPVPVAVPEVPVAVPVVPEVPLEIPLPVPEVPMEIDRVPSLQSSFDIGDVPEEIIDFDAAFEDAMRIPLPEPEPAKPKKIPIDLVASPQQPRTIEEILSSYKKIDFPQPTDAFMAEYGGITEVDKRTAAAIHSEQSRKIRKIKIKS